MPGASEHPSDKGAEIAAWYNEFYKVEQTEFPSWYRFALGDLAPRIERGSKLVELGCGQSVGLRYLAENGYLEPGDIYGIDQSEVAVSFLAEKLPGANLEVGDAHGLSFQDGLFDYVLLMEVIEHLDEPRRALDEVVRVLKPGGRLYLSFPNYLNLPWLLVRVLAEKLNRPEWIVLQPVDRIFTTPQVIAMCRRAGLRYQRCIGSVYYPIKLWRYESPRVTSALNSLGLNHLAFHPTLVFEKP